MHEPGCCFPVIDRFYCCLRSSCQISTTENIRLTALHCFRINVWKSPFIELQWWHGILHCNYNINMTILNEIMEEKEKACFLLLYLSCVFLCIYVITFLFLVPATVILFFIFSSTCGLIYLWTDRVCSKQVSQWNMPYNFWWIHNKK